eukprot:5843001-Alexandrium_andersonii.AAC.1
MGQSAASADASASAEGGSARGSADASGDVEMAEPNVPPAEGGEERTSSIPVITIADEEEPDDGGAPSRATT